MGGNGMDKIIVKVVGKSRENRPSAGSAGLKTQLPGMSGTVSNLMNSGTGIFEKAKGRT